MAVAGATNLEELDASTARSFRHVPGLDGVRGLAVLFVVMLHFGSVWTVRGRDLFAGGFVGVDIFFVLSGFLITSILVNERAKTGGVSFRRFYLRRALRLLPALVIALVVHAVFVQRHDQTTHDDILNAVYALLYVSNFAEIYFMKSMIHSGLSLTWSLSIEEQFYVVWPALLLFGVLRIARTRNAVLVLIAAGALASALMRVYLWHWGGGFPVAYMRTDARADGLLIGAAAAFLWRWRLVPVRYLNQLAIAAASGLVLVVVFWPKESSGMFWGGFTLVSLAAAVVVLAVAENAPVLTSITTWSPLRALGRVSYGVYLFHTLALAMALKINDGRGPLRLTVVGLIITAGLTVTSWFVVEQPFLRLKDRLTSV